MTLVYIRGATAVCLSALRKRMYIALTSAFTKVRALCGLPPFLWHHQVD